MKMKAHEKVEKILNETLEQIFDWIVQPKMPAYDK